MADLLDTECSVITKHVRNIYKTKELNRKAVVAEIETTAADGKIYQVEYFNLEAIISDGYRVKEKSFILVIILVHGYY